MSGAICKVFTPWSGGRCVAIDFRWALKQVGNSSDMLSFLLERFGRRATFSAPSPDSSICVIGDVHGCIFQLEKLLPKVPQDHRVILLKMTQTEAKTVPTYLTQSTPTQRIFRTELSATATRRRNMIMRRIGLIISIGEQLWLQSAG